MKSNLVLVGAGGMAQSYSPVLKELNIKFDVVCRSHNSAINFYNITGKHAIPEGINNYLVNNNPKLAIVAVEAESLFKITCDLLNRGVKRILVEKPAALFGKELEIIQNLEQKNKAQVFVAYNRRFFSSVEKLIDLADQDGGISSLSFDFTEWSDNIEPLVKGGEVKNRWLLSNSTHVLDLAFYLIGKPKDISCMRNKGLDWHPIASNFVGCGISQNDILFNYRANWDSAGRWGLTANTKNFMFKLCPMEQLFMTERNSTSEVQIKLEDENDINYKPGLLRQVEDFIALNKDTRIPSIKEHINMYDIYTKIAGYDD